MFELDSTLTHIDVPPERVVSVITPLNNPAVQTDLSEPEPTLAYICSAQMESGHFGMWIYFYHQDSHVARIYSWSEGEIGRDQFADVETMALDFVESMGFLMDNSQYRKKPPEERIAFYNSLPCFSADLDRFVQREENKDDPSLLDISEDMEEIDLDDIEGESDIELVEAQEEPGVKSVLDEYEAEHPEENVNIDEVNPFDDLHAAAEAAPVKSAEAEPVEVEPIEVEPEEVASAELETIDEAEPLAEIDIAGEDSPQTESFEAEPLEEIDIAGVEESEEIDPAVAQVVRESTPRGESEDLDDTLAGLDELEGFGNEPEAPNPFADGDDTGDLDNAFDTMVEHEDEEIVEDIEPATPEDVIAEEVDFSEPEPEPEPEPESFDIDIDAAADVPVEPADAGAEDLLSDESIEVVGGTESPAAPETPSFEDVAATAEEPASGGDFGIDFGEGEGVSFDAEGGSEAEVTEPEPEVAAPPAPEPAAEQSTAAKAPDVGETSTDLDFGSIDEPGESTASGWEAEPPEPEAPAMASLEEELAGEEPEPPATVAGPTLSKEQINERLEKVGRLLSIW